MVCNPKIILQPETIYIPPPTPTLPLPHYVTEVFVIDQGFLTPHYKENGQHFLEAMS